MSEYPTFILLTTDFKPMVGGIAEYLHQLFQEIGQYYPVQVFTTVAGIPSGSLNYQVQKLPGLLELMSDEERSRFQSLNSSQYIYFLKKYANQQLQGVIELSQKTPVKIFIGVWNLVAHCWCRSLERAGLGYSFFAHGTELMTASYEGVSGWREFDFRQSQAIYPCSYGTAQLLSPQIQTTVPIQVIHPGIEFNLDSSDEMSAAWLQFQDQISFQDQNFNVLTVARLVPHKGIDLVIRSMVQLVAEFPKLHYWIAGDGPDLERLQNLCHSYQLEEQIHFLGFVDDLVKEALYHHCDIFIMPSRSGQGLEWEGFGIVFLEAGRAGKPCISSNQGGVSDAIADNVTGFLVNPENVDALTQAIRILLENSNLRTQFGRNAQARIQEQFTWPIIARHFLELQHLSSPV